MACSLVNAITPVAIPTRVRCSSLCGRSPYPASGVFLKNSRSLNGALNVNCPTVAPTVVLATASGSDMVQVDQRGPSPVPRTQQQRDQSPLSLLDAFDPVSSGSLTQMMDAMDRLLNATFTTTVPTTMRKGIRTPWDVAEDEGGFYLRMDMPGFGKEDVKVVVEDEVLVIKAEKQSEGKEKDIWASRNSSKFNTRVILPDNVVSQEIKAEVKNGVLTVTVPKMKRDEQKKVINVEVL
eukprot:c20307_g1_i1 orf=489-1199(-)